MKTAHQFRSGNYCGALVSGWLISSKAKHATLAWQRVVVPDILMNSPSITTNQAAIAALLRVIKVPLVICRRCTAFFID
jgi:hypothetical protein